MSLNVLLTGYTGFVTDRFLAEAFPGCRVIVTGDCPVKSSAANHITIYRGDFTRETCARTFAVYDFDRVVFFSGGTAPFGAPDGRELTALADLLEACRPHTQVLCCLGTLHPDGFADAVPEGALLALCRRSALRVGAVNVLVTPWIYSAEVRQPALTALFLPGEHRLPCPENQELTFLAAEDLAQLLSRMFENWETSAEPYEVPNAFVCRAGVLTEMIRLTVPESELTFRFAQGRIFPIPTRGSAALRDRYMWFPVYALTEDLPLLARGCRKPRSRALSDRLNAALPGRVLLRTAELLTGAALMQLLMNQDGVSAQFRMIDYRLLYVVIIGTMYDIPMGLAAATLASCSLAWAYMNEGTSLLSLFYSPGNWLPFVAYLMAGAACGYVRSKDRSLLEISRGETRSVTERYEYLSRINEDILQEKTEYKQQILGSRDSFGKIFQITQQLNQTQPRLLFTAALQVLETVMNTSCAAIIRTAGEQRYGRLLIGSESRNFPRSLDVTAYYDCVRSVENGSVWVNRDFREGLPDYLYAVRRDGRIEILVLIQEAAFDQKTLYYENLFRILCGLISNALINALNYQDATRREHCVKGTDSVLLEKFFREELRTAAAGAETRQVPYLLLRTEAEGRTPAQLEPLCAARIRGEDLMGMIGEDLYLLLFQAVPEDLPVIRKRLAAGGIRAEELSRERQAPLLEAKREEPV